MPFVKSDGTFLRKPDSRRVEDDVNVTTTCSCLMALALTNSFNEFYKAAKIKRDASTIFRTMVLAPWMSSGLTANNAFSTTLVLRSFGFLEEEDLFVDKKGSEATLQDESIKEWQLNLGIVDAASLAKKLHNRLDPASEFLWLGLTDNTRDDLNRGLSVAQSASSGAPKINTATLALELRRIIQSGWIYDPARFDKASEETKNDLDRKPTGYKLAEANYHLLVDQYPAEFAKPVSLSLKKIASLMASKPNNFSINEYPPSAAVVYWFVDAIDRAKMALSGPQWRNLCRWATREFNHERSLVVAEHDATMDPVAMGMSACLCARLRNIGDASRYGTRKILPSLVELERSIEELVSKQTKTGIFHKYFPMFHYQEAGSNFCFTFELLEAILHEFGHNDNRLLKAPGFIHALEKAVLWCENNRLKYSEAEIEYSGWNSGGDLKTLRKGQPESWATGVVHMFLWELSLRLSERIQQEILMKYNAVPQKRPNWKPTKGDPIESENLDQLLDIEVRLKGNPDTVCSVLKTHIIENYAFEDEKSLRRNPISGTPLSGLLFGPPGTSKTQVIKAIANDLNWPLLSITPSHFLKGTLANIYLQADEIFNDLMDLSGVLVFFDEMDALVQTRESQANLDITSQFLTTTMLPKLADLHNQAQVVFFMATNFQDRFDPAIKRPGRFDLLLCMGPPMLDEKTSRLHVAYRLKSGNAQTTKAGELIRKYLRDDPRLKEQLGLYTFDELKAFLKTIGVAKSIGDNIAGLGAATFRKRLREDSRYVTLKMSDLDPLRKIGVKWKRLSELDKKKFTLDQLKAKKQQPTLIIRYFCDRRESRLQS
jgi:hypothetical protein